ncbi:hypothetical protein MMC13_006101 [Lambiella insularis]|nr:hypothetical protein [Lambiella insularis]
MLELDISTRSAHGHEIPDDVSVPIQELRSQISNGRMQADVRWCNAYTTQYTKIHGSSTKQAWIWAVGPQQGIMDGDSSRERKEESEWVSSGNIQQHSSYAKSIGEYYRNSYLTIAALDSTDANQGFLNARSSPTGYQRCPDPDLFMRRTPLRLDDAFQTAVLSQRGWTLQERLLSTRTVYYGTNEIFWECSTHTARETSFQIGDEALNLSVMTTSKCTLLDADLAMCLPSDLFVTWCKVIKEFSRRSLTYERDQRHAILGIASVVEKRTKSKFLLGGIFTDDVVGLLFLQYSEGKGTSPSPKLVMAVN